MNCKFLASIICIAALSLGACSSNNAAGTSNNQGGNGADTGGNGAGNGGNGNGGPDPDPTPTPDPDPDSAAAAALTAARTALTDAQTAVARANAEAEAAETANTPGARSEARRLIGEARIALAKAVERAGAAVTAGDAGSDADYGAALELRTEIIAYNTAQTTALATAEGKVVWYGYPLRRAAIGSGDVQVPRRDASDATITRTLRHSPDPAGGTTPVDNPARITATTFKDIPYSAGKTVFSGSGDEFKVDGYSKRLSSSTVLPTTGNSGSAHYTGLKLTGDGLEIRFAEGSSNPYGYPDTSPKLGSPVTSITGYSSWDLKIDFKEPQFIFKGTETAPNAITSWAGNGDFYWTSVVDLDPSQLQGGDNYVANAFLSTLPSDYSKTLGTYQVWLSNHIGVADKNTEPVDTSKPPYDLDDDQFYLNYAAYGLFVYTTDPGLNWAIWSANPTTDEDNGRIQTINVGYKAFQNAAGKKTSDINTAISSGTFSGKTIAYAYRGEAEEVIAATDRFPPVETKLLRGDVSLTVNIPKTAGTDGTLSGTINGFEEWDVAENRWKSGGIRMINTESTRSAVTVTSVTLASGTITEETGAFSGTTTATGTGTLADVLTTATGAYKGNFYGPVTDSIKLEAVGSWYVGDGSDKEQWDIMGSFGAKQAQPAANN